MSAPRATRPYMPGYGILPAEDGSGLLPWSWAEERLRSSRNYWVVSVRPDGRPHSMPVWGVWYEGTFWFSSSLGSRKARNLTAKSRCVVTTEDADSPVVVEGTAELIREPAALETLLTLENQKYGTDFGIEMLDPAENACFQVHPTQAFALKEEDFTGSPTRWTFDARKDPTTTG
ncbi:MAG: pyridoxamine 5'-phosphate oxidase family protein [Candidatus Dormibacteraeota bacterium]|nr:pyridoxamine 5'-phosphate oxidase family protein [Candidatus Dormibacteraeota bacterium]